MLPALPRRTLGLGFVAALSALALPLGAANAEAAKVSAEVLVVHAYSPPKGSEGPREVDPSLSRVRGLDRDPFTNYQTLKLLSRPMVQLSREKPAEVELPNGRVLTLRLLETLGDRRVRLELSIKKANSDHEYLKRLEVIASPNEPLFIAGQKYGEKWMNAVLVLGIRAGEGLKPTAR